MAVLREIETGRRMEYKEHDDPQAMNGSLVPICPKHKIYMMKRLRNMRTVKNWQPLRTHSVCAVTHVHEYSSTALLPRSQTVLRLRC